MSKIEWTEATWNVHVGCSLKSAGCENCYAMKFAHRGLSESHRRLTEMGPKGPRWNGTVRFMPERLEQPLRWRKPRRIFVNSMSDLFHDAVPFEEIAAVFGVMAACPQHTFQVLTKRPARALEFFAWLERSGDPLVEILGALLDHTWRVEFDWRELRPLPNVHLGVSVEDHATADERIPLLLQCPAALRWVSYEPALGPVDFAPWVFGPTLCRSCGSTGAHYDTNPHGKPVGYVCSMGAEHPTDEHGEIEPGKVRCSSCGSLDVDEQVPLGWLVVGGESGPGARPFGIGWARSTVRQCQAADVPVFVKQLGAKPAIAINASSGEFIPWEQDSRKGDDPSEWPEDLRVREIPTAELNRMDGERMEVM